LTTNVLLGIIGCTLMFDKKGIIAAYLMEKLLFVLLLWYIFYCHSSKIAFV